MVISELHDWLDCSIHKAQHSATREFVPSVMQILPIPYEVHNVAGELG